MPHDKLIRMANQIAAFFAPMPDQDAALEGVAQHIKRFWTPRMRQSLVSAIDAGHAEDLHDLARLAVQRYRDGLSA